MGHEPRQTTSNLGHLNKPSIQALIHGLNRHYYSIGINYRKTGLEENMLMNLHKHVWTEALQMDDFREEGGKNQDKLKRLVGLAEGYEKRVKEETELTMDQLKTRYVGKVDPKKRMSTSPRRNGCNTNDVCRSGRRWSTIDRRQHRVSVKANDRQRSFGSKDERSKWSSRWSSEREHGCGRGAMMQRPPPFASCISQTQIIDSDGAWTIVYSISPSSINPVFWGNWVFSVLYDLKNPDPHCPLHSHQPETLTPASLVTLSNLFTSGPSLLVCYGGEG